MNVTSLASEWANEQEKAEAKAFEKALNSMKPYTPADEVEQAFRQGLMQGKSTDKRLIQIADHYGFTNQADMLCEESAEFITARNKIKRGIFESAYNLKEELADVLIVALQLRYMLGEKNIDNIIEQKIQRQLERISNEQALAFLQKLESGEIKI